jgi:glutamate synthase (NADPH) large chain
MAKLRALPPGSPFHRRTLPLLFPTRQDGPGLEKAMDELCRRASEAVGRNGILILSDRGAMRPRRRSKPAGDGRRAPSPHARGLRTQCGLIVESGDAREVHHFALLLGYGAGAINPYLAFETLRDLRARACCPASRNDQAVTRYIKASTRGC